jgi:hypothetical protein
MRFLKLSICIFAAAALLAPITANAKEMMSKDVTTQSGKTMQFHMVKMHGQMMILVPASSACEVFGHFMAGC